MKRYPIDFRTFPFAGIIPVFTAVSLSFVSAVSAQDTPAPVKNAVPPAQIQPVTETEVVPELVEVEYGKLENDFNAVLAKANSVLEAARVFDSQTPENLNSKKSKYLECLAILAKGEESISESLKNKPGILLQEIKEKMIILRHACCREYAEFIYQTSRDTFINILADKNLNQASANGLELRKELVVAKFMYYLGTEKGDQAQLAEAVAADKTSDFASRVDDIIAQCTKISDYADFVDKTSLESKDPRYQITQTDIQKIYRQGETLYRNRRFTEARDKMEMILQLDPYNERAIQMLTRIYRKLYFIADMRQYNEMLYDQALIEWRWVENGPKLDTNPIIPDNAVREYADTNSPLYEKAKKIIIPSIAFDQYTVRQATSELQQKSKELDQERTGVTIMLLGPKEDASGKTSGSNLLDSTVTFSLQNVPLLEAIRYLCLHTGLKFRINEKKKVIVIGMQDRISEGDTKDKVYIPIRRATVNRMINYKVTTEGEGSSKKSDSKEFSVEGGMDMSVEETFKSGIAASMAKRSKAPDYSAKLRDYFKSLGFPFPEGTFIAYDSKKDRLVIQNTPDVLRKLELLIREIDIDTPLVLMESKIMEISMKDLEELGFDWLLTHENTNERWSFNIASPLRDTLGGGNNVLINNMNILPNFGSDNVWNLFLTVNAIDQTSRTEVLSTPKLMAKNGEQAVIRMVREMYFPESWTEPEIGTSCGSSVTLEPSTPEFGDAKDIGVTFTATPVVSPNNYTILLTLAPSVVELVGWSDYSYNIVFGTFGTPANNSNSSSTNTESTTSKITLKMPELSNRAVETQVKVYDGQTVVIGGMLNDRQSRRDDRWPVLGEIPLLGRLFTNDSTNTEKVNLLISVTSRVISGDGAPLRSNPATGLPDFRR